MEISLNTPALLFPAITYNFNLNHTSSVPIITNYTVTVFFEDHGLNSVSKTVKIKVNP